MVAPNKSSKSAAYYKGLVSARVPHKGNDATANQHPDLHFTRTQVSMAMEAAEFYNDE